MPDSAQPGTLGYGAWNLSYMVRGEIRESILPSLSRSSDETGRTETSEVLPVAVAVTAFSKAGASPSICLRRLVLTIAPLRFCGTSRLPPRVWPRMRTRPSGVGTNIAMDLRRGDNLGPKSQLEREPWRRGF